MIDNNVDIYGEEEKIIEWFEDFLKVADDSFKLSADKFKGYYKRCVNILFDLKYQGNKRADVKIDVKSKEPQFDAIYTEDVVQFIENGLYKSILMHIKDKPNFLQQAVNKGLISEEAADRIKNCERVKLKNISVADACVLLNGTSDNGVEEEKLNESLVPLLKLYRYNNLQIKYAHTARVVWLANWQIEQLGISDDLLRSIIRTAALFHDVGRFYQGTFYNTYGDDALKALEVDGVNDHAEAGYYFSLLDMSYLNIMGCATDEDLIIHAIAAIVVKKHSISNELLGCYDRSISEFKTGDDIKDILLNFFLRCYGESEKFDDKFCAKYEPQFEFETQQIRAKFIDQIVVRLQNLYLSDTNYNELYSTIDDIFGYESNDIVLENVNDIEIFTAKDNGEKANTMLLTPINIKKLRRKKLLKLLIDYGYKEENVTDFVDKLVAEAEVAQIFAQYDIVSVVDKVFEQKKYNNIELNGDVISSIIMPLAIVDDCDKMDILVQRAIKRFVGWKPNGITVNVLKRIENDEESNYNESLIDVLKEAFKFNIEIDDEKIVLNQPLIEQIKSCANNCLEFRKSLENFGINLLELKVGTEFNSESSVYKCLTSPYLGSTLNVSYELMHSVHPNLEDRIYAEMELILPQDLRENVFKLNKERKMRKNKKGNEVFFPNDVNASDEKRFVWWNSFPALWWHMDQFITTNMRSVTSLKFIRETKMLEKIRGIYKEDCPEEFHVFVDEIIDFAQEFIDCALTLKKSDTGEILFSEEEKEGYKPVTFTDKELMINIRDEAVRRHNENKNKKDNATNLSGNISGGFDSNNELDDMFGESSDGSIKKFDDENDNGVGKKTFK